MTSRRVSAAFPAFWVAVLGLMLMEGCTTDRRFTDAVLERDLAQLRAQRAVHESKETETRAKIAEAELVVAKVRAEIAEAELAEAKVRAELAAVCGTEAAP